MERLFRQDLFYRLNVVPVKLPALRERLDDLPLLAAHFLRKYCDKNQKQIRSISREAMEALGSYAYPGNVRELENIIERAVIKEKSEVLQRAELGLAASARKARPYQLGGELELFRTMKQEARGTVRAGVPVPAAAPVQGEHEQVRGARGHEHQEPAREMARYGLKKEDFKDQQKAGKG